MKTWTFGVSQLFDVRHFPNHWPTSALNFGIWVTLGAAPGDLNNFLNLWLNLTSDHPESSWTQLLSTSLDSGVSHFVNHKPTCWDFSTIGAAPLTLMHFFWMIHKILLMVHQNLSEPWTLVFWCPGCFWNLWMCGPELTLGAAPSDSVDLSLILPSDYPTIVLNPRTRLL